MCRKGISPCSLDTIKGESFVKIILAAKFAVHFKM